MSAQGQITEFLKGMKPEESGVIPITANQIALQTGVARDQVNKTLYNLKQHDKIELVKGPNGRDIIGLKPIDLEPKARGGARTPRAERVRYAQPVIVAADAPRRRSIQTPNLDEYARQKARFDSLRSELGDLVTATFNENAYAEEGLRVLTRLAAMEQQVIDLRRENEEQARDLGLMRSRKQAAVAEAVASNGTAVVHAD